MSNLVEIAKSVAEAALQIVGLLTMVYAVSYVAARAVFKARAKHPTTTQVNLPAGGVNVRLVMDEVPSE